MSDSFKYLYKKGYGQNKSKNAINIWYCPDSSVGRARD